MIRSSSRWAIILCAVALLVWPNAADANRATRRAKRAYQSAQKHYKAERYRSALRDYKKAYRIKRLPGFLFNMAQCHRKLGELDQAVGAYKDYLEKSPEAPNKDVVEELISEVETEIEAAQREAEKSFQDEEPTPAKTVAEAKPEPKPEVESEADVETKTEVAPEPTEPTVKKETVRAPEPVRAKAGNDIERHRAAPAAAVTADTIIATTHPMRGMAYTGFGIGLAAVGAGTVFGLMTNSDQSTFDNLGCRSDVSVLGPDDVATCKSLKSSGERNALLSNVLMGAGGAMFVGSLLLYFVDPGHQDGRDMGARVDVTPSSILVTVPW